MNAHALGLFGLITVVVALVAISKILHINAWELLYMAGLFGLLIVSIYQRKQP